MTGPDPAFWSGRRVLVTGHTGFKGAWLCMLLQRLGARVAGLALSADPDGAYAAMRPTVESHIVDIRDADAVAARVRAIRPQTVLHLAAQALVGEGHARPLETWATNAMGTAHVLDALQAAPASVAVVVTSDKVYGADGGGAFDETSPLVGSDPYSASKVAAEHVAACWRERLAPLGCRVATARSGNVLGGGDWAPSRLVPNVIRAHRRGGPVLLPRPDAVRPWQYVLDVLAGYLRYVEMLERDAAPPALNFGPADGSVVTVAQLVARLQSQLGGTPHWRQGEPDHAETETLRLDSSRAFALLDWTPVAGMTGTVQWTTGWYAAWLGGADMQLYGRRHIAEWAEVGLGHGYSSLQ